MHSFLIGLTGPARCGKDTAATYIHQSFGFDQFAFAEPIKKAIHTIFEPFGVSLASLEGESKELPIARLDKSPRELMQTLAKISNAKHLAHSAGASIYGAVISDVRFRNEAMWIRNQGGLLIHIRREAAGKVRKHISERGVSIKPGDIVISNDSDIDEFWAKIDDAILAHIKMAA
jgi:hypothetical protein